MCVVGIFDYFTELPNLPADKVDEAFDQLFNVNVKSNLLSVIAARDELIRNRGDVVPTVGSVVAACILTAWSHPGRVRSEAAFAALAGTCPIPASSGNTLRYRLNRRGDRRLNRALTTVALVRMRTHPPTRAYVARRRQESRTTKEIMRSLKQYITRQLFRTLAAAHSVPATP